MAAVEVGEGDGCGVYDIAAVARYPEPCSLTLPDREGNERVSKTVTVHGPVNFNLRALDHRLCFNEYMLLRA